MTFLKFFKPTSAPKDGLTQPEREAIADLLHFGMYADNHIASGEDQLIADVIGALDWDPAVAFSSFETRSLARMREAKSATDGKSLFFASLASRLTSPKSRTLALSLATKLFSSDGSVAAPESALLAELKSLLK